MPGFCRCHWELCTRRPGNGHRRLDGRIAEGGVLLLVLDGNRYNAKLSPGQVVKSMMQETEMGVSGRVADRFCDDTAPLAFSLDFNFP